MAAQGGTGVGGKKGKDCPAEASGMKQLRERRGARDAGTPEGAAPGVSPGRLAAMPDGPPQLAGPLRPAANTVPVRSRSVAMMRSKAARSDSDRSAVRRAAKSRASGTISL